MKEFDHQISGLGFNRTGYPGAFTPTVERIIQEIIGITGGPVLHLFSGVSRIGDVRIDLGTQEATHRQDVLDFINSDKRRFRLCVLDPPYEIKRKAKLYEYSRVSSVAADVKLRRALVEYFSLFVDNVVWLDMCAPLPAGFQRRKLWFLFPGGYHTIRILSWLVKTMPDRADSAASGEGTCQESGGKG